MDAVHLLQQAVAGNAAQKLRRLADVLEATDRPAEDLVRGVQGDLEALALLQLAAA